MGAISLKFLINVELQFPFLDDGIEGFHCMRNTARCHDTSPRFSHFMFLSDERAPITSCHLLVIVVLVFVYAVF